MWFAFLWDVPGRCRCFFRGMGVRARRAKVNGNPLFTGGLVVEASVVCAGVVAVGGCHVSLRQCI